MSGTQQLKKNSQAMASSYEKSNDQTGAGEGGGTAQESSKCEELLKGNIQQLIWRRMGISSSVCECVCFPL